MNNKSLIEIINRKKHYEKLDEIQLEQSSFNELFWTCDYLETKLAIKLVDTKESYYRIRASKNKRNAFN